MYYLACFIVQSRSVSFRQRLGLCEHSNGCNYVLATDRDKIGIGFVDWGDDKQVQYKTEEEPSPNQS